MHAAFAMQADALTCVSQGQLPLVAAVETCGFVNAPIQALPRGNCFGEAADGCASRVSFFAT